MSETFNLEQFPTSESALRMLSYVSDGFYDRSYVGKWMYQVMGSEYDTAREKIESLPAQMFPETATWGLMYHEMKWGLPIRYNLPYEERRRLIYQKRDYRLPMTPYRMELYLQNATGFEVHIADVADPGAYGFMPQHPNVFTAYFIGEGTLDTKKVHEVLDQIKQSHTTYKMSERIEIISDNSNLEQIILRRIRFAIKMPFWRCRVFDGGWLLDGSIILCEKRRYGLRLCLKSHIRIFLPEESFIFATVKIGAVKLFLKEFFQMGLQNRISVGTAERCKIAMRVHAHITSSVEKVEVSVTTKTADYWFLNGSVTFDGSKRFDSIYREEDIE